MITHLSQGGDAVRIRVQNQFGTTALHADAAAVALTQGQGPAEVPGTSRAVTFNGGHASVTVPTGGQVWSDPVKLATRPRDNVAVSLFVPDVEQPGRSHEHPLETPVRSGRRLCRAVREALWQPAVEPLHRAVCAAVGG